MNAHPQTEILPEILTAKEGVELLRCSKEQQLKKAAGRLDAILQQGPIPYDVLQARTPRTTAGLEYRSQQNAA